MLIKKKKKKIDLKEKKTTKYTEKFQNRNERFTGRKFSSINKNF